MDFPRLYRERLQVQKGIAALQRIAHYATATPRLIYTVLYHADRDRLTYSGGTLYGDTYLAYRHAPIPSWANHAYMTLRLPTRDVSFYTLVRDKFIVNSDGALVNRDITAKGDIALSHYERTSLDEAIRWYKAAGEQEILVSRRDRSWQETEHGAPIDTNLLMRYGRKAVIRNTDLAPPEKDDVSRYALAQDFETQPEPYSESLRITKDLNEATKGLYLNPVQV